MVKICVTCKKPAMGDCKFKTVPHMARHTCPDMAFVLSYLAQEAAKEIAAEWYKQDTGYYEP